MTAQHIHVVIAFKQTENGIEAEPPRSFESAAVAEAAARILAQSHVGVIAWSRLANPDAGEYSEPEILARLGTIPEWFDRRGGVEVKMADDPNLARAREELKFSKPQRTTAELAVSDSKIEATRTPSSRIA